MLVRTPILPLLAALIGLSGGHLVFAAGSDAPPWQPQRAGETSVPYMEPQLIDGNVYLDVPPAACEGPAFPGDGALPYGGMSGQPQYWSWQALPDGLIYHSYLAGMKEPRLSGIVFHEKDAGWQLGATLGGRVGIFRYGSTDADLPDGWQLDVEGAAFPRLDLENNWDLVSADFRAGVPLTYGVGPFRAKLAYYHLSAHMGDELILNVPGSGADRINYARDAVVLGIAYYLLPSVRLYGEADWGFYTDGGSEPWQFQFGAEYSPVESGFRGAPFFAVNGQLLQELNFSGSVVAQVGWQWRGKSGHRLRIGAHYLNGQSDQFQFYRFHEQQIGGGIWYDF